MKIRWFLSESLVLLIGVCLTASCENLDFGETPADTQEPSTQSFPQATGTGTRWAPMTVDDIRYGEDLDGTYWVIGYAVGAAYQNMGNATFTMPTTYTANILLASTPTTSNSAECIPVQLVSSRMQKAFSLQAHPERHCQCVLIQGTYGQYLRVPGLRAASDGQWLPNFDISSIGIAPQPWEEADSIL